MNNDLGLKMVAVADLNKLRVYEAKGIKILRKIGELPLSLHKQHRHEKGTYHKGSGPDSRFEPHTSSKDLEHQGTAKIVVNYLEQTLTHNHEISELMIVAEPKLLGHIRSQLSNHLKKILTKEIVKDLAHQDMHKIEQIIFS